MTERRVERGKEGEGEREREEREREREREREAEGGREGKKVWMGMDRTKRYIPKMEDEWKAGGKEKKFCFTRKKRRDEEE